MLHLRIIVPASLAPAVAELLGADPRVTHLVRLRDAALRPSGDIVECDVSREAASDVLGALRGMGIGGDDSAITIVPIAAEISHSATRAEQEAPGSPDDGLVWDLVLGQALADAKPSWSYYSFLTLATLISGIAFILDSPILVVGSMVVGPEFATVAAFTVGIVARRTALMKATAALLGSGLVVAIAVTMVVSFFGAKLGWIDAASLVGGHPMTDFIWKPDRWSFVVAILAGAAGVLSITVGRGNALVGVFISVTTVPAAGLMGTTAALGLWNEVLGGALQLVINLVGMVLAGVVILLIQRFVQNRRSRYSARRRAKAVAAR